MASSGPLEGSSEEAYGAASFDVADVNTDQPCLFVHGEIDVSTSPAMRDQLQRLIDGGAQRLAIDFRDMSFIDSSGLGVLVGILRRLRERGGSDLVVRELQEAPRRVFEITGLDRLFTIEN